jgi:endo-1,4-beta-xylanase
MNTEKNGGMNMVLRPNLHCWNQFLGVSLALIILVAMIPKQAHSQTDTIQTNVPALKDVYAHDFTIGCLLSYRNIGFPDDPPVPGQSAVVTPNGGYLIKFHMNSMSPGNNMKPQYTVDITGSAAAYAAAGTPAERDSIETHPIVRFNGDMIAQLNWAQRQGFTFRGHTLVWHSQTPAAFFRSGYSASAARLTKEKMIERMDNYIKEIVRLIHEGWPGLLSAMDVVNEAVTDAGADRTTDSEWYMTFGDNSYIMKAFELVRQHTVEYGETQIKLYYNDYNTHVASKADGIVRVLTPVFQAGYLDGIGMQEHDGNSYPTATQWIATYNKFDTICTEMAVTELDVTTGSANPSPTVLAIQANQYGQLFKCFVERSYKSGRGKIINVSKDGLNDQYTFKTNQSSSLWDAQNQCKPAFFAVVDVGFNYNALDSLIAYADSLEEDKYTAESWATFASALQSAKNALTRNYSASVSAADSLGMARDNLSAAIEGLVPVAVGVDNPGGEPGAFALGQNYPNPFNPITRITYSLAERVDVSLKVYDLLGREVATLYAGVQPQGNYGVTFDGTGLTSGVYIYRLHAGKFEESRKLILLK